MSLKDRDIIINMGNIEMYPVKDVEDAVKQLKELIRTKEEEEYPLHISQFYDFIDEVFGK